MRDWGFWEWLAFVSLWIAGLIEAAGVAMLRAREVRRRLPGFLRSHNWAFLPLGLLTIATLILASKAIIRISAKDHHQIGGCGGRRAEERSSKTGDRRG